MLPKFLLADNSQELPDTIFVVHNESPRFIVECDVDDFWSNQIIHWIDDQPENESITEQLLTEAEDFLEEEFDNQEDLYDEEFGVN
ncbi:MAG TPA: hypothetical protein PKH79_05960 [Prolixibacteraceae bacterium]|nr:hypothetical protein [Prolixibacteraceae bacterium]HPS11799.1 hypothetical protein [Prolixibacteraceae bacterium]